MKAQVLYGIDNLKYVEVNDPMPKPGEALVKVHRCGICGSDIPRIFKTGAHNMPIVPGHEFMGIVDKCDDKPELVGKRVGVFPLIPCMKCCQCKEHRYEMCENYNYLGSRCDGGFAEYVSVPLWNLLPIPDEVTDDEAAMLEPMCVAVHALRRLELLDAGSCESDQTIAVCGLGTIGLLVTMFLKDAGYENVYFIGNKTVQNEMVKRIGYSDDHFCDVRYGEPSSFIKEKTDGKGVDYYIECIGRSESYTQAVNLTAPLGKVMLVGNPASDMELPRNVYWKILRNQMSLMGTWNSSYLGRNVRIAATSESGGGNSKFAQGDDWAYVLERLESWHKSLQMLSPTTLITHRFDLEHMQEGLQIMRKKSEEYIKIMVDLG